MRWHGKRVLSIFLFSLSLCILSVMKQSDSVVAHPQVSTKVENTPIASVVSCSDVAYAKELPPPGPACERELFARRGKPYMFTARAGIAFGVSSAPDKPGRLYLWVDNQTEKAINLYTCCAQTLYEYIDIYSSDGHRVLSKREQEIQKARSQGIEDPPQICTCSGSAFVQPHTVAILDSDDISSWYSLPPGRYIISERNPPALYNLGPNVPRVPLGLAILLP